MKMQTKAPKIIKNQINKLSAIKISVLYINLFFAIKYLQFYKCGYLLCCKNLFKLIDIAIDAA